MKSVRGVVLLFLAAAVLVECFPRERDVESVEDKDDDDVPLPSVPAVAVPAGPGFAYIPSFYSFFPDFDLVSRIRGLVSRLKSEIGDSFGDIDWSKGNTTSTTKVIDGHVVTVNETSYKDDDSDLVLHVKVIDVKPTEGADETPDVSSETSESSPDSNEEAPAPSAPSSEETLGNEIPKQVGEADNMP